MAAIFQLRRGTTGGKPTLTAGELYVDQTSENLIVGVNGSKEITLLKLNDINTGSLHLTGDITLSGSIYLGNAIADNISALGVFTTNLVPNPNNTIDLGTTSSYWRNVYATNISGAIAATNGVVSGSSQITSILDSLNSFSGSQLTQNSNLATISGSLISTASANVLSITALNSFSSSQLTQNTALATISGSLISTASNHEQRLGQIESKSGSYDTRFNSLATISGSLISTASANTISVTNLNSFSSSQLTQNSNLATITGSLISTASANVLSIASLNSYTSSLQQAITASGVNLTINGNLTVKGTTTQIDSTTIQIGDNIIELNGTGIANGGLLVKDPTGGSTLSGSLLWDSTNDYWKGGTLSNESKLLRAGGDSVISASAQLTELNSFTSSQLTQNTALATISGSLISTASANTISITNLNSFSGSQLTQNIALATISGSLISTASANTISITNINNITASLNTSVTNINSFTSSQLTQNATLGTYTASVNQTTSLLNLYTASANTWSGTIDTRFTTLGTYTASVNQTTSLLNLYTASANIWSGTIDTRFTTLQQVTSSLISATGSLFLSASRMTASITDHEGRITYVESLNGISGGNPLVPLNAFSASINTFTASIAGTNAFTTSTNSRLNSIEAATSSYETKGRSIVSSSAQITAFGFISSSAAIPSGTVSGSSQLTSSFDLRYLVTGSVTSSINALNTATSSYETNGRSIVSGSSQIPSLLPTGVVSGSSQITYASISSISAGIVSGSSQVTPLLPTGVISGSSQILGASGIVSGSSQITYASISSIPAGIVSGSSQVIGILDSLNTFSGSANTRFTEIGVVSGSLITSASAAKTTNDSQGVSITNLNLTTASLNTSVSNLNTATSSYETKGRSIVSSSAQIVPLLPAGVVSGSSQVITSNAITLGTHTTGNYIQTITGTANQITVAGSGLESADVTLSTPQNIHTSAHVQFHCIGLGTAASGVAGEVRATGDITAFYSSDIRLKENIVPIENALSKVESISGNTYDWKEGYEEIHSHKGNDVGVIAQEIEEILPQIVTNRDNGYKAVQYEKIVPLLIEAIKELSVKIKELENK